MPPVRRLVIALTCFVSVVILGSLGYVLVEGVRPSDALYMTIISVFGVGYREAFFLDASGRVLTMVVIVLGVGSLTFVTVTGIDFLLEGHLLDILGRRRMDRQIMAQEKHTIVCGFGRVGRQVARQLRDENSPVIVVDRDPERLAQATGDNVLTVEGDGSQEGVLLAAGLARAQSLVACTADDAENILIALTAKGVSPNTFVVVRVKDEENEHKARRAGADRVIAPAAIGGRRIAALVTRPYVVDFLDVVTHGTDMDLVLEEVAIRASSPLADHSLRDAQVRERFGANVVAIRRAADSVLSTRPSPDDVLHAGDTLVVMGGREDLDRLQALGR